MKVIGFVPASVQLDLEPCEVPILQDELATAIESSGGSLRQELQQRPGRPLAGERVREVSNWLLEYRNLLSQLSDRTLHADGRVPVLTPMPVAHDLVPSCCSEAIERLAAAVKQRGDREELEPLARAVLAWTQTLADLRLLDEGGVEALDL